MLSSGVAKGIGIAREYYEHRKEQKQTDTSHAEGASPPHPVVAPPEAEDDHDGKLDVDDENDDEEAWAIDDA
jgi:hypothetical protein